MMTEKLSSLEYGPLLASRLPAILARRGVPYEETEGGLLVPVSPAAAGAVSDLILEDLRLPELIRLAELLPKEPREDGRVVLRAEELTRGKASSGRAAAAAFCYMTEWEELIAEGFLRFRLQFLLGEWASALDRAAEELGFGSPF